MTRPAWPHGENGALAQRDVQTALATAAVETARQAFLDSGTATDTQCAQLVRNYQDAVRKLTAVNGNSSRDEQTVPPGNPAIAALIIATRNLAEITKSDGPPVAQLQLRDPADPGLLYGSIPLTRAGLLYLAGQVNKAGGATVHRIEHR